MEKGFVSRLATLAKTPFSEQQDLIQWCLVAIVIATVIFGWTRVLDHVTE